MLLYNTVKFHSKIASVIVYHNDCLPLLTTDNLVGAKDPRTLASIKEQSILKEFSPGISLGGMMLKLKLQYFGNLMGSVDSL